jgi:hypothetical protein
MRTAAAALAALMLGACVSAGDSRNVGAITLTFRIEPSRVKLGQPVRFSLNFHNNSGRAQTIRYRSGQRYDFYVTLSGKEIWRWSEGRAFTQALSSDVIPGSTGRRYDEMWEPASRGTYRAYAVPGAEGFGGALSGSFEVR